MPTTGWWQANHADGFPLVVSLIFQIFLKIFLCRANRITLAEAC